MERRHLLKAIPAVGAGLLLSQVPFTAAASKQNISVASRYATDFKQAIITDPRLIGFENVEHNFALTSLVIEGQIPNDLVGDFYRNGPAKHARNGQRYQHLFEGDGMLQHFHIENGKVTHQGKFIETPKYTKEQGSGKFLYSGADTKIENSLPVTHPDAINVANTNIIPVGRDLWALWEAGSATRIDAKTLDYIEHVDLGKQSHYGSSLKGLPFSAHPKVSPDGDIWNFGLHPSGSVVLYQLSASG